ncbi:MAG: efflux RND transporter periplasmic adaptor subunit [Myxococcota bacterium]
MKRTSRRVLFLLALVPGLLVGCQERKAEVEIRPTPVMTVAVRAIDLTDHILATGQLVAKAEAEVSAQVSGQVTAVAVEEGSAVLPEAVVLQIDPERRGLELASQEARVAQARARLGEAERSLGRIQKLHTRNAVSKAQLDEVETELRFARAGLEAAAAQLGLAARALADATVQAPFAGWIARRYVNVGEYVGEGQKLFDLVALDPIEVEFHLPEADSSRVHVGVPVKVSVAPYPSERFDAVVTVVSPTIDPRTRTLRVKATIDNSDGRLRPGLFARTDLGVAQRTGVLMVPEDAVLQRADGSVLFVMDGDDRVRRLRIETGIYHEGLVEIQADVAVGDFVVVRGQGELIHGSSVSLRNADGSPAAMATTVLGEAEATPAPGAGG